MSMSLRDPSLLRTQCFVNGQWVDGPSGKRFAVLNPANGETLAEVADVGAEETRVAIEAADRAMQSWQARPAKERADLLRKWYELITANQEDLALIMTLEQGSLRCDANVSLRPVSYTHLTLPTTKALCIYRWSPYQ